MDLRPYLKNFELFEGLHDNDLAHVAQIARGARYRNGTRIMAEGEQGLTLYLIVKGQVRISKHVAGVGDEALAVLGEGQHFGEMSVLDGTVRSADAFAITDAALIAITREDLIGLLENDKELAYRILWSIVRTLSARLRETNEKLRSFFSLNSMF
jgi:CRP-like cAMP-binding protein